MECSLLAKILPMKKVIFGTLLAAVAVMSAFSSCKKKSDPTKDWTCTCYINYNYLVVSYTDTMIINITNKTVDQANSQCPAQQSVTQHIAGQTLTGSGPCTLN